MGHEKTRKYKFFLHFPFLLFEKICFPTIFKDFRFNDRGRVYEKLCENIYLPRFLTRLKEDNKIEVELE